MYHAVRVLGDGTRRVNRSSPQARDTRYCLSCVSRSRRPPARSSSDRDLNVAMSRRRLRHRPGPQALLFYRCGRVGQGGARRCCRRWMADRGAVVQKGPVQIPATTSIRLKTSSTACLNGCWLLCVILTWWLTGRSAFRGATSPISVRTESTYLRLVPSLRVQHQVLVWFSGKVPGEWLSKWPQLRTWPVARTPCQSKVAGLGAFEKNRCRMVASNDSTARNQLAHHQLGFRAGHRLTCGDGVRERQTLQK